MAVKPVVLALSRSGEDVAHKVAAALGAAVHGRDGRVTREDALFADALEHVRGLFAAGVPVVGLDASGVREVVRDCENGLLLDAPDAERFGAALAWVVNQPHDRAKAMQTSASATAAAFSSERTADLALETYRTMRHRPDNSRAHDYELWRRTARKLGVEWDLAAAAVVAASRALFNSSTSA